MNVVILQGRLTDTDITDTVNQYASVSSKGEKP
jgi:ACT domain-containing protein